MRQSRRMSLVEACTNVTAGFFVALATQIIVFPWFDLTPTITEHFGIALIFTAVSVIRSYLVRRLFA